MTKIWKPFLILSLLASLWGAMATPGIGALGQGGWDAERPQWNVQPLELGRSQVQWQELLLPSPALTCPQA